MTDTRIVPVKASGCYDITIGNGILPKVGEMLTAVKKACKAVIVTDSNVDKLYSDTVKESLENAGFSVEKYVFFAGEKSKNAETFIDILEFLASKKITRSDLVVALGGGVVGDIAGFAASCYLRGVDFVQIPTTLLAAVDSSVGGKTAIDLKAGKNLAGAFYQPIAVICDTDTFKTLPEKEISCGYAEVIKYGVLFSKDFFDSLVNKSLHINEIVEKSVIFKRDIVEKDEFDKGERMLLNLGHTAAHGIEKMSSYTVTHGQAVAVGMVIASRISEKLDLCEKGLCEEIKKALSLYNLPSEYDVAANELYEASLSDKKISGGKITLVLLEKIGKCTLYEVNVEQVSSLFEDALK